VSRVPTPPVPSRENTCDDFRAAPTPQRRAKSRRSDGHAGPKRVLALLSFLAVVALASPSLAERARVALAQPSDPDEVQAEIATRIKAELETAQFDVVVVPLDPGVDPRQGVEVAQLEPRPIATLAIIRLQNRPAVDVWVSDRVTGKTLVKRLDVGKRPDAHVSSALAIHAVELLRASLLEVRTEAGRHEGPRAEEPSPIPAEVTAWVDRAIVPEPVRPLFEPPAIAIGAATIYSSVSMGAAFAPAVRASIGSPGGVAGRLSLVGPGFGGQLRSPSGTAFVRQELALVEFLYAPSRRTIVPFGSVGLGAYHLYMRGDATDPAYSGVTHHVWSVLADLGAGVAARLGSSAIFLDVHGFVTQPSARLMIGNSTIATVGKPSLLASIGLNSSF
jgi:hypothetical protein